MTKTVGVLVFEVHTWGVDRKLYGPFESEDVLDAILCIRGWRRIEVKGDLYYAIKLKDGTIHVGKGLLLNIPRIMPIIAIPS